MENCLFCKIANGEIPCHKIYEDEEVLAFLDITNDPEGHTLVIPKIHVENLMDTDSDTFAYTLQIAQEIAQHYVNIGYADGINIYINSGSSAGQEVMHLHIHILPRKVGDGINFARPEKPSTEDLAVVAEKLRLQIME